jgi:uncharacterized protein (DUF2249 family)
MQIIKDKGLTNSEKRTAILSIIPTNQRPRALEALKKLEEEEQKPIIPINIAVPDIKQLIKEEPLEYTFDDIQEKQEKKVDKPKKTEEDIIVENWRDPQIGYIMDGTAIGRNISNVITREINKGTPIYDFALLGLFNKELIHRIIKENGAGYLFPGLVEIAEHYNDGGEVRKTMGTTNLELKKSWLYEKDRNSLIRLNNTLQRKEED